MNIFKCRLMTASLIALVSYGIGANTRADPAERSEWVYPGPDGKLVFQYEPKGTNEVQKLP